MIKETVLLPEELYFLGCIMKADYIDYGYIAAMSDIENNYERMKRRCILDLAHRGIVRERISGEISVEPDVKAVLSNVFFGKRQLTLDVNRPCIDNCRSVYRFHLNDGRITSSVTADRGFRLKETAFEEVESSVYKMLGGYRLNKDEKIYSSANVSRVIAAKRAVVDVGSSSLLFAEYEGGLYRVEGESLLAVSGDRAAAEVLDFFREVRQ